jgi:hypothetical protein
VTVVTIKRVDGLLEIVRSELPRPVTSSGHFEDWGVAAPALVATGALLFDAIMAATPPRGRVQAEVLARSLTEYTIAFAWVAGADPDERQRRMRALVRNDFNERAKADRKLVDHLRRRKPYAEFFDPNTTRPGGPLPRTLLDVTSRARLEALKDDESIPPLPNAFDMAFAADARWMPEIDLVAQNPFAVIYLVLFTGPSFIAHPSITAMTVLCTGQPPNLVVGAPQGLGGSDMPYGPSLSTFVNMLLVASRTLGWPDEAGVRAVLARG